MTYRGIAVPNLGTPGEEYDPVRQSQVQSDLERVLKDISTALVELESLTESNLTTLFDGVGEQTPLVGTDKILLRTGTGLEYTEIQDLPHAGGFPYAPATGRWYAPNSVIADASSRAEAALVADRLYVMPFMANEEVTVTDLGCYVTTSQAGSNVAVGLYGSSAQGTPGALLGSTGQLASTSTGAKSATLSAAVVLEPGLLYWLGVGNDTNSVGVHGLTPASVCGVGRSAIGTGDEDTHAYVALSGSWTDLPDPFGSPTWTAGGAPMGFMLV